MTIALFPNHPLIRLDAHDFEEALWHSHVQDA